MESGWNLWRTFNRSETKAVLIRFRALQEMDREMRTETAVTRNEVATEIAHIYGAISDCPLPSAKALYPGAIEALQDAGERLHDAGGVQAMRAVLPLVFRMTGEQHPIGADFNRIWDGVGEWRA